MKNIRVDDLLITTFMDIDRLDPLKPGNSKLVLFL